jgi:hypothetical protein
MQKMNDIYRTDLSFILNDIAELLDLSDTQYEVAEQRYRAVGRWLGEGTSPLAVYSPTIYPQGSFLLGTVVKIWGKDDAYDIDLVFELNLSKDSISQKTLKNLVGDRLKESDVYRHMLDNEGRRCWTIIYENDAKFHLDILPALPNVEFRTVLKNQGVPKILADTSIAITDITQPNYDRIDPAWPRSNPKGYAAWFHSRMITQFEAVRNNLAEAMKADIQNVPTHRIKTPLQRSIQLLKRDRDITFEKKDDKPATIIITTLAALSYNNELDLVQAFRSIVDEMPTHIAVKNGIPWVENPVDPMENFADRWQDPDHPDRQKDFEDWHGKLQNDLQTVLACEDIDRVCELLIPMFGEKVTVPAVNNYKDRLQARRRFISTAPTIIKPDNKPWGF